MDYKNIPTDEELKQIFIHNLNNIIKTRNITQTELANRIGTSQVMISRYTTGKSIPNAMVLRRLSKVLKCSPDDFFE